MSTPANTNGQQTITRPAPHARIRCPHCGRVATNEASFFVHGPEATVQRLKIECPAGHGLIPHPEPAESRWSER